jgi:hypothetical protein
VSQTWQQEARETSDDEHTNPASSRSHLVSDSGPLSCSRLMDIRARPYLVNAGLWRALHRSDPQAQACQFDAVSGGHLFPAALYGYRTMHPGGRQ